jgi:hypothetical protein
VSIPLLIAAIALLAPAGIQASAGPTTAAPADGVATDRLGEKVAQRGKKRPGCRRFCQQAGGFGDDCDEEVEDCDPVEIPGQKVGGTRDRVVSIKATCELGHDCVGAIILSSFKGADDFKPFGEYGRADLKIPAGETRNVKVGISKAGLAYLKKNGPDKSGFATVPLIDDAPPVPVSISGKLVLQKP